MVSTGELANVAVPLARALLEIGSRICGPDFMANGRTLSSLGYGALDLAGLQRFLKTGFT